MLALEPQDGAAPADAPQTTFGAYRLLEKIGEGGMGVVWRAQQEQPIRRVVALKSSSLAGIPARCSPGSSRNARRWRS